MGLFIVNKNLFLSYDRFAKDRTGCPVRRFNAGLITKRIIEWTEPDSSSIDGWTDWTDRSGLVLKTMLFVL